MTVWANRAPALSLLALLAATAAVAQPIQLIPRTAPPAAAAEAVPAAESAPVAPPADGIQVQSLRAPDVSSAGTLDDGNGGLGATLWRGSDRGAVEGLITTLPAPQRSPAARDLSRRLLLSIAEVPAGQPVAPSLLGLRAERLFALGDAEGAAALARLAPADLRDARLARVGAEGALLKGDDTAPCQTAQRWVREDSDPFWLKLATYCRIVGGDTNGAALSLQLLREQGEDDPSFQTLANLLLKQPGAKLDSLKQPTPLHIAMLRNLKRAPPADAYVDAPAPALAALVQLGGGDPDQRLALLEAAEAIGAATPADLARAYAAIPFTAEDRRAPDTVLAKLGDQPARATALTVQVVTAQTAAGAKGEALRRALVHAAQRGTLLQTARVLLPQAQAVPADTPYVPLGPAVLRVLLAGGEINAARTWFPMLQGIDPAVAAQVYPLMLLTLDGVTLDPAAWQRWQGTLGDLSPGDRARRIAAAVLLVEAMGHTAPPEAWSAAASARFDGSVNSAALARRALPRAVAAKRRGESVLLSLQVLGPRAADLGTAATAIAAWRDVGLLAEARALALEAAVAHGL